MRHKIDKLLPKGLAWSLCDLCRMEKDPGSTDTFDLYRSSFNEGLNNNQPTIRGMYWYCSVLSLTMNTWDHNVISLSTVVFPRTKYCSFAEADQDLRFFFKLMGKSNLQKVRCKPVLNYLNIFCFKLESKVQETSSRPEFEITVSNISEIDMISV